MYVRLFQEMIFTQNMKKTLFSGLRKSTLLTSLVLVLTVVLAPQVPALNSILVPQAYADGQEEISGFVYDDINGSSSFDAGDVGRDGQMVLLQEASIPFTQIGTTTTVNGTFTFNAQNSTISPGADYYLYVFNDADDTFTEGDFGVYVAGLATDEERDGGMFGLFKQNSFSGATFYDLNRDGVRQDGEAPLVNLELTLQDSEGNILAGPLQTSLSGSYELRSGVIAPGTYYLDFAQYFTPYVFTEQDVGADEARDSDVGSDGRIPVTVTYAATHTNLDVGMYRANILIGGRVFTDLNENGVEDVSEPGVNNIQVSAINRETMLSIAATTTNSDGEYQLSVDPTSCSEHASLEQDSPISIHCPVAEAGGYYQLSFTTGMNCEMGSTSFVLTTAGGAELYNESCDFFGNLQPNTNYSFIFSTAELGTGTANLTVQNLEPVMDTVMVYNLTLTYINVVANFDNLPSGAVFTDPNIGVDTTIDSDVINSNGDTINLFAGAGDVVENVDAGLLLASEEEESSGSGSTSTSSGSGSTSSGSGSASSGGSGGGMRFARSQNTLPKISATYSPCLVSGRSVSLVFQDISSNADVDFLTSITFLNEPKRYLIKGYGDGTFGINRQLTRFELLKIALSSNCAGSGGAFTTTNTFFSDVPTDDSEKSRVIGEGYRLGIIKGVDDKFYPDQPVSYAEMIKILFSASAYFKDGKPIAELDENVVGLTDQSFTQTVVYAKRLNILPFPNETPFPQDHLVTRQEMISVLANFIRAMRGTVMVN